MGTRGRALCSIAVPLLVVSCGSGRASPSPTSPVMASPTPSVASPTAGVVSYASATFSYRVSLPTPWRGSDCQSAVFDEPPLIAVDIFTRVSDYEESGTDMGSKDPGFVRITIEHDQGLTPVQWIEKGRLGQTVAQVVSPTTVDGRPAVRVSGGVYARADVVAERGRMYVIGYSMRDASDRSLRADLETIVASFRFLGDAEVRAIPTPTVPVLQSAEQLVDALADALERSDIDALRPLTDRRASASA